MVSTLRTQRRSGIWKSVAAGAFGGLAGGIAMSGYQALVNAAAKAIAGRPALNQDEEATAGAAKAISRVAFQHELTKEETNRAVPALQCSVGLAFGALYGLLADRAPQCTAGKGTAYGAAIWLAGDEFVVPVFGLAEGPAQASVPAHLNELGSHLIYGLVTDLTRSWALKSL